jgi:hypothetical protein
VARQKVQDPVAQGGVSSIIISLGGTMVLNTGLSLMNSVLT